MPLADPLLDKLYRAQDGMQRLQQALDLPFMPSRQLPIVEIWREFNSMRAEISRLTAENKRLADEIKHRNRPTCKPTAS